MSNSHISRVNMVNNNFLARFTNVYTYTFRSLSFSLSVVSMNKYAFLNCLHFILIVGWYRNSMKSIFDDHCSPNSVQRWQYWPSHEMGRKWVVSLMASVDRKANLVSRCSLHGSEKMKSLSILNCSLECLQQFIVDDMTCDLSDNKYLLASCAHAQHIHELLRQFFWKLFTHYNSTTASYRTVVLLMLFSHIMSLLPTIKMGIFNMRWSKWYLNCFHIYNYIKSLRWTIAKTQKTRKVCCLVETE